MKINLWGQQVAVLQRSVLALFLLIVVQACDNDPDPVIPAGADGFFVVNEGAFNGSNTSISFFDRETGEMTNDVFAAKNGRPLGDQAQSITVFEDKAYIVVQNSAKVEVINADDYSSIKTITDGIESPRYFMGISSTKGYLSDWGADGETGTVKVIDLTNFTVSKLIIHGKGANKMVRKGDKVYVANSGGYGNDNTVSVIDINSDEVTASITVGDNPNSLRFDKDGNLWVLCGGKFIYNNDFTIDEVNSTKPTLHKIGSDNRESFKLTLPVIRYPGAAQLEINTAGDKLFFTYNGGVYSVATNASTTVIDEFVDQEFYGLAVDPFNDNVIGLEAIDFSSPGKIYIYKSTGDLEKSIVVGIAPNSVGFKD